MAAAKPKAIDLNLTAVAGLFARDETEHRAISHRWTPDLRLAVCVEVSDEWVETLWTAAVEVVIPEPAERRVKWMRQHLDETHRRLVARLLSKVIDYGGTQGVATITGLDPHHIRQARLDLQIRLADDSREWARRAGVARPKE